MIILVATTVLILNHYSIFSTNRCALALYVSNYSDLDSVNIIVSMDNYIIYNYYHNNKEIASSQHFFKASLGYHNFVVNVLDAKGKLIISRRFKINTILTRSIIVEFQNEKTWNSGIADNGYAILVDYSHRREPFDLIYYPSDMGMPYGTFQIQNNY